MSYYLNADEIFEVGLEIERNGKRFYELAAEQVAEPRVRDLCRELAAWEGQHVALFETLRRELPPEAREGAAFDPNGEEAAYVKAAADSHIFLQDRAIGDLVADCGSGGDVLDLAISFEKDSVTFYTAMKALVPPHEGQAHVETLIREELNHIAILTARKKELPG